MRDQQQRILYPGTEHDFTLPSGHRMHYRKLGSGPPVLLIHGLVASSFSWRFNLPALAPYFTAYAVDLLGMGKSARPSGIDVSPRALARGLLAFLQAQDAGPWSIVGSSHGGAVSMWLARLAASAQVPLHRLVLCAPANPWSQHGRRLAPFAAHPISRAVVNASGWAYIPIRRLTFGRMYGNRSLITEETLAGYAQPLKIKGTLPHCLNLLKNWVANVDELADVMRGIDIPTLLVWGSKDRLVFFNSAQRMLDTLPNARLVVIEGTGHLPYEERPKEFNAAVLPFLRDTH